MKNYNYINWYFKHFYYYNITIREYLDVEKILWINHVIEMANNDNKYKTLYNNIIRKKKIEQLNEKKKH